MSIPEGTKTQQSSKESAIVKEFLLYFFYCHANLEPEPEGQVHVCAEVFLGGESPSPRRQLCQVFDLAPSCESQLVTPQ